MINPRNLSKRIVTFPHFNPVFVHIKYTSNMAACYDNDVIDVTALYVYTGAHNCNSFVACISSITGME